MHVKMSPVERLLSRFKLKIVVFKAPNAISSKKPHWFIGQPNIKCYRIVLMCKCYYMYSMKKRLMIGNRSLRLFFQILNKTVKFAEHVTFLFYFLLILLFLFHDDCSNATYVLQLFSDYDVCTTWYLACEIVWI